MSKYRINVRFDLDKPTEAKATRYLQSLDKCNPSEQRKKNWPN